MKAALGITIVVLGVFASLGALSSDDPYTRIVL
jgi:hypothetical protein